MRTKEQIENTKKWVSALRSGKYKQTTKQLKKGDAYCCLGVACLVSGEEFDKNDNCLGKNGLLPEKVKDFFGLRWNGASYFSNELTTLNDRGSTFNEIADVIESEPDGLFV